jgi:hypothetical protein
MSKSLIDKLRKQAEEAANFAFFVIISALLIAIAGIVLGVVYLFTRR